MTKLTKNQLRKRKQLLVGLGFEVIGLYMLIILGNMSGLIPLVLGLGVLLWRMK